MMQNGHTSTNVHHTKSIRVLARDIDSFWTINVHVIDETGNQFAMDYYVNTFDVEVMLNHAASLEEGAKSIRELAAKKAVVAQCEECDGTGKVACEECK